MADSPSQGSCTVRLSDGLLLLAFGVVALVLSFADLGAVRVPSRPWQPGRAGDTVVADLGSAVPLERLCAYVGLGTGSYLIELSADGEAWQPLRVEQPDPWGQIEWRAASLAGVRARWVRVTAEETGLALGEIALWGSGRELVVPTGVEPSGAGWHALFDEPRTATYTPSRRTGTYFDEVYYARAGLEIASGRPDPETTHPPLAKLLVAAGISCFGPCPFGWRFFPALAGAAAVPVLFLLARRLFGRTDLAAMAALLFCFDDLRFVESRIATPDTLVLLATLLAFLGMHVAVTARRPVPWLLVAGLCLGAGVACKWSALYAAPGVALLFAVMAWRRRDLARLLPVGLACLLVLPGAVYSASHLPMLASGRTFADALQWQARMFSYHSGVAEAHPFASPWWQWPLAIRPVWMYEGLADLAAGMVRSIVAIGNPAAWWPAALAVPFVAIIGALRRDRSAAFIILAFLSLYLPWAVAPRRLTFLYHYLPCVPFALLALTRALGWLGERLPRVRPPTAAWLALQILLFALFLPILSGLAVPLSYARLLRWLPSWMFWR